VAWSSERWAGSAQPPPEPFLRAASLALALGSLSPARAAGPPKLARLSAARGPCTTLGVFSYLVKKIASGFAETSPATLWNSGMFHVSERGQAWLDRQNGSWRRDHRWGWRGHSLVCSITEHLAG
jgi:hypothetical protein